MFLYYCRIFTVFMPQKHILYKSIYQLYKSLLFAFFTVIIPHKYNLQMQKSGTKTGLISFLPDCKSGGVASGKTFAAHQGVSIFLYHLDVTDKAQEDIDTINKTTNPPN